MASSLPIDLVTGGTGLVGGNLVRQLVSAQRRVRLLVRRTSNLGLFQDVADLQFVEGDVTDPASLRAALDGVENVYHCAANVSVQRRMTDSIWRTNVIGTENMLQAVQSSRARRLVFCSSVDALGLPEGKKPANEQTPWNWDRLGVENAYARSKYEAHRRVLQAAQAGLDAVIVCPTYMFGPYDARPTSGQMILTIARRLQHGYPTGGNNFADVADVTQGMLSAAQTGRRGEVYILGGANYTYREIFKIIAGVVHVLPPFFPIPYPAAWILGWLSEQLECAAGLKTGLNRATVQTSYLPHYYDPAKAIRELGLSQTPIKTAIERAVAWFRLQKMLPS